MFDKELLKKTQLNLIILIIDISINVPSISPAIAYLIAKTLTNEESLEEMGFTEKNSFEEITSVLKDSAHEYYSDPENIRPLENILIDINLKNSSCKMILL